MKLDIFVAQIITAPNVDHFTTSDVRSAYIALKNDPSIDPIVIRRKVYAELLKLEKLINSELASKVQNSFIKNNELKFNEEIGLGTRYQACEDINFLIDAWENGASFQNINEVMVRHTCNFQKRIIATNGIYEVRGATASRYKFLGLIIVLKWAVISLTKFKRIGYSYFLIKGYITGYNNYK